MNHPTIGRRVNYWPRLEERTLPGDQPFDAGIVYVHKAEGATQIVNLSVINELGYAVPGKVGITLRQTPAEAVPGEASWMEYHVAADKRAAGTDKSVTGR